MAGQKGERKSSAATAVDDANGGAPSMSPAHKAAMARGRNESRVIRRYLDALEASRPKRGRRRTTASLETRLALVEDHLAAADPLSRVHLIQERLNLQAELARRSDVPDLDALEADFVAVAAAYAARRGISWEAWRGAGVPAAVLRRAGIPAKPPAS